MVKAAFKAAPGLVRDFGEVEKLQVSQKGPKDFVSNADHSAENKIREILETARPDFGFLLEETGALEGEGPDTWVVDPLDGTMNFLHGFPHFSISIAVLKEGEPFAGVIYDPLRDEIFWAEKGVGAFLGRHRLRVSARSPQDVMLVAVSHMDLQSHLPAEASYMNKTCLRNTGSAALDLAYTAAGRLDVMISKDLKPWDVAAGIILVKEAGGFASTWDGQSVHDLEAPIIASNAKISAKTFGLHT
jgi:myo-inositol-1(or 4)-monophosphatase